MKLFKEIKYYFQYRWLTGHISIGGLTIYGRNAMHWGIDLRTKKYGYICTRLPLPCFGKWWALYLYCSPDATPSNSTFFIGKKHDIESWSTARLRYKYLGHNFNCESNRSAVQAIRYFSPGDNNEILDIVRRAKTEIKACHKALNLKPEDAKTLVSDLNRYISIYGGNDG